MDFHFETLVLLLDQGAHRRTLLMRVYWVLFCDVSIFLAALFFNFSGTIARLSLAVRITFSATYINLKYATP